MNLLTISFVSIMRDVHCDKLNYLMKVVRLRCGLVETTGQEVRVGGR